MVGQIIGVLCLFDVLKISWIWALALGGACRWAVPVAGLFGVCNVNMLHKTLRSRNVLYFLTNVLGYVLLFCLALGDNSALYVA